MNCKDSEKPGAEPGWSLPCTPPCLLPSWKEESPTPSGAPSRRAKKRPTVGRRKNLLWVVDATYRGSVRRPTVGPFRSPLQSIFRQGEYALHPQARIPSLFYQERAFHCYSLRPPLLAWCASVYPVGDKSPF